MGILSSIKNGVKKVGNALRSGLGQLANIGKELFNRLLGAVEFIANLFGIMPQKKLRMRIVILRNITGSRLASESDVTPVIERTKRIFQSVLKTKIIPAGGVMILKPDDIPPIEALEPGCDTDAWLDDMGVAGNYYSLHTATNPSSAIIGYATPVTVFIVENVHGKKGCSLGPLTNYVTLDLDGIKSITIGSSGDDVSATIGPLWLAHEIGHCCGLLHSDFKGKVYDAGNLMHPTADEGIDLTKFQKAFARNSRHITFL